MQEIQRLSDVHMKNLQVDEDKVAQEIAQLSEVIGHFQSSMQQLLPPALASTPVS